MSSCPAGEHECHSVVLALHQAGYVVAVIPILELRELEAAADCPDLLGLGTGEPADQVDVMDGHIDELAAGSGGKGQIAVKCGPGILGVAADQDYIADVAVLDFFLCDPIGLVEAAHKAEHEDLIGMSLDDLLCLEALFNVFCQRLLAENMLAGFHCDADHIHMGGGIGKDRNCFHFGVCAHGRGLRINLFNVQLVSDFLCAGSVAIADSDELHAGNAVRDIACMLITKTSDSDHTHLKLFHDSFLLSKPFPESFFES